ncbi:MAG: hypothetical protein ACXABO_06500 [Promethearchaeota archaeon]|jgi:hypothetical protein
MEKLKLTDQEKSAFYRDITRNLAVDYFYVFDNVPLHFVYRDKLVLGEMTELEKRNKIITETLWLDAYNTYIVGNAAYPFLYRGRVLQMALQTYLMGVEYFVAAEQDSNRVYTNAEGVQANFNSWMNSTGWTVMQNSRKSTPRASWRSFLGNPDRTIRIGSLIPVGNQILTEIIVNWSRDGVLRDTTFGVVLLYDVDGTVLMDRSYIDLDNWPSSRTIPGTGNQSQKEGVTDRLYDYQKTQQLPVRLSDLEKRNMSIIEGKWLETYNTNFDTKIFHPKRFRMQLPPQKCSYNLEIAKEIEAIVKEEAPSRKMRLAMTYAKGNQVVVEGIISWTEKGVFRESPFISFLLLDKDGLIIRDRRHITLQNWPGAEKTRERLGL